MIGIKSDQGNVRTLNEDYAEFYQDENYTICVVADGMGGHNAGEIASKTASKALIKYIRENMDFNLSKEVLIKSIKHANLKVYNLSHCSENYGGMGTTLVASLVTRDKTLVANIGDSACYAIKGKEIKKITKDHSLVQELLDSGSISPEQASNHPKKNVITRAVGTEEEVAIDVFEVNNKEYDYLLLCSDGLTNEVNLKEVLSINIEENQLQIICEKLVEEAKANGGRDNITVMLFGGGVQI
ncbi:Stp1/IreP family PP2C-type Ser/Thr phosphatase [Clostridium sartagoforme]|uniref:Stp1/IreP family PP2C-type Ser/Thr phosphatase n=1 Tax=Clostridium sartagoforme TaxID=84031 RepID=A0A4S2DQ10_9CLOT|nr:MULTISPECIES: Stp1/IreP family PP2C-type Ser/Thr phosphatase [Clostridium]MBS5937695.1 Stp1/IreP family PP2C-type Ser/Thr phosphatase [Clostridium sp.]TGY43932.1 Stp1/IreP family PP2C-type Ser/Thr phosphatase [Clostridium sartagoforme]